MALTKKQRSKGRYHKKSARFGFHAWQLETKFNTLIEAMIKDGVKLATTEYECHAWFPAEWIPEDGVGGRMPLDPTTIYVELPLGENEDENPRWSFTLSHLVWSLLSGNESGGGRIEGQKLRNKFKEVRDSFITQAKKIDNALARK